METTRIRVFFLARPMGNRWSAEENEDWPVHHGEFSSENLSKYFTDKLKVFGKDVVFSGGDLIRTREDLEGNRQKAEEEAGVLVFILCLYTHELQREIIGWGKPTIVFSPPESPLSSLTWMSNLQPAKGKSNVIAIASSDFADVGRKIGVLKAINKLRQTRALYHSTDTSDVSRQRRKEIFGRDPGNVYQSEADLADDTVIQQIKDKTGVEFKWISLERLVEAYETADGQAAESLARQWLDEAEEVVEPTRQNVVQSCKLYYGIKRIMEEEKAQAFTELGMCMGTGPYPLPCLAFAILNNEGLAGICQTDRKSLITQLMVGYVADRPGFIGHLHIDTARNLIGISHDFCATKMAGVSDKAESYNLRNHQGLYRSTCLNVKLQVGQKVTIAQFASLNEPKMHVFTGIIDSNVDPHRDCRTSVAVKVKDAKGLLRNCLREDYPLSDPGLHRVLFYGDWVDEIEDLGQLLGFEVVHEMK